MKEDAQELSRKLKRLLKRKGGLRMKCSNPACGHEKFEVTVQHKSIDADHPDRLPVKLVCAKCGKPVKAWITNEQMKAMINIQEMLLEKYTSIVKALQVPVRKKSLLDRLLGK